MQFGPKELADEYSVCCNHLHRPFTIFLNITPSALTPFDTSDEELLFNYSFKSSLISHLLIAVALHLTKAEVCCFGEVTEVSICKLKPKKNILRK